ncbi:MAG: tetratricopeptide repeat protein [PVC group bacterium]|nr:tetratricopeptide repeat protein [PVC group bacterium]
MKNKTIYLIGIVIIIAIALATVFFFLRQQVWEERFVKSEEFSAHMRAEIEILKQEKTRLEDKNEKLSADVVGHLSRINAFQDGKKQLMSKLEVSEKKLNASEALINKWKQEKSSTAALEQTVTNLEQELKSERTRFYYNLGVAYTKAKMYEEAIKAYDEALEINPQNHEALYNLGLIYHMITKEPHKAVLQYKLYLEANPAGEDVKEVIAWIQELSEE